MCVLTVFKDKTRSAAISSLEQDSANRFNTCVSRLVSGTTQATSAESASRVLGCGYGIATSDADARNAEYRRDRPGSCATKDRSHFPEGAITVFKAIMGAYREARTAAAVAEVASGAAKSAGAAEVLKAQTDLRSAAERAASEAGLDRPGFGPKVVASAISDATEMAAHD